MSGTPAPSIAVYLTYLGNNTKQGGESKAAFAGETNSDGRVAMWKAWNHHDANHANQYSMEEVFRRTEGEMRWAMRFETGTYWEAKGVKPFFPEVEIKFATQGYGGKDVSAVEEKGKHWHVPLLLGPYSYTTYRGS
jgi:5-hydroxyisourate hydrolase